MKTEIYRWRLSVELKSKMERQARLHKVRVSSILDRAVRDWLRKHPAQDREAKTQKELHAAAEKYLGILRRQGSGAADIVRETVRRRVRERIRRSQKKADPSSLKA
jgi:hypothetical protein